jgi:short-subunit dehydrogenase
MNVLIVGASAGLGRALAEEGARLGHNLLLVATDSRDLVPLQSDLALRYGIRVEWVACDLSAAGVAVPAVVRAAEAFEADGIMLPAGLAAEDDSGTLDEGAALRLLGVNFLGPVSIVAKLWPGLVSRRFAFVVGFGSVAAIRGRSRNVIYSAAKRALTSSFESLCHMAARTGVSVQFYQMGYLETQQTFGKKLMVPPCTPRHAARRVWRGVRKTGCWFLPAFWRIIDVLLRWTPWWIYRRLDF